MNRRTVPVALALVLAMACHSESPMPTKPTPVDPSTIPATPATPTPVPAPTLTTVVIQSPAPTSVAPGQTTQATLLARFSDGSERTVTTDAVWVTSQPQIATVAAGVITGRASGRSQVRATYLNRTVFFNIVVKPDGTFVVSGIITEPGSVTVPAATVAVVGNTLSQVASSTGFYELFGVSGTVTLLVTKPGYLDESRILTVTQDQKFDVQIKPISPPVSLAGSYRMTVTISPSCTIVPDDQKTRTYTATITQDNARMTVRLSDATFASSKDNFKATVFGSTVTFDLGDSYYVYYYGAVIQETLPGGQVLGIWGKMITTALSQSISGNLVGGFNYREANRTRSCSASDSKIVLTKN